MDIQDYLTCIEKGEIPESTPYQFYQHSWGDFHNSVKMYEIRDKVRSSCMYALVDMNWTANLANWIGRRKVLEIMAGKGWLAKALSLHGVRIKATDSKEWHKDSKEVFKIWRMKAKAAVKRHGPRHDVLLCSWPYMDDQFYEACLEWGSEKPIVYIGESEGGCTASDNFFKAFCKEEEYSLPQWDGIHDYVMIGRMRFPS